ncbi:uncharacterized protein LOC111889278 [Lactuca sativa]|uniref:uncharacterized protein LOC111889278 n=1 Tax=Lactuca sativa TaxID=4236 RepID=UPI001C6918DF|nr:uncharacterized protein LOC111889278 [Lactuca sativa]
MEESIPYFGHRFEQIQSPYVRHPLEQTQEEHKYLYASITNVSNFVSVKLSSARNYHLWQTQMLCLLETYNLHGIVDVTTTRSRALSPEMEKQYNSLVKGWIFASISEELLGTVVNLDSAKAVWDKLKSFYDPVLISSQQAQTNKEAETDTETETRGLDKGEIPLDRAYEYLLKVDKGARIPKRRSAPSEGSFHRSGKFGVILLVNAIYAKNFGLASDLVRKFPEFAVKDDNVLMTIVKNFPSRLDYGEALIYPLLMGDICERIVKRGRDSFEILVDYYKNIVDVIQEIPDDVIFGTIQLLLYLTLMGPLAMLSWIYFMLRVLMLMLYFPFFMFYLLFWKVATRVVPPIKHIEKKMKERKKAKEVLALICDEIDKLGHPDARRRLYTGPIHEAARQNLYEVVHEILTRSPTAMQFKDESGYDIIQLAVIYRSERIYNFIYSIGEREGIYRTIEDSFRNNMLHLVGNLPPSQKLRRRSGPALQLQRELQWRQEVERLVAPICITQKNAFMETPDMVFRREHDNLLKEGEKWMKAVAESCSITAALITTIVFAAAITVPGGSNQETGIPVFTKEIAFTIFAISDAISLFASSTSLLLFLSILTGSFDEQDFVVNLPRRLLIGLCTLMLSTTTMMVAFAATLFLVFCHKRPWMLAPICVLSSVPIASFGILQMPLIIDFYRSTYGHIFGLPENNNKLKTNDI